MVIDDLDIGRTFLGPHKADAPALIDANAVLSLTVGLERFEMVRGRRPKIVERRCRMEHVEFAQGDLLKSLELSDASALPEIPGRPVFEALDHKGR